MGSSLQLPRSASEICKPNTMRPVRPYYVPLRRFVFHRYDLCEPPDRLIGRGNPHPSKFRPLDKAVRSRRMEILGLAPTDVAVQALALCLHRRHAAIRHADTKSTAIAAEVPHCTSRAQTEDILSESSRGLGFKPLCRLFTRRQPHGRPDGNANPKRHRNQKSSHEGPLIVTAQVCNPQSAI